MIIDPKPYQSTHFLYTISEPHVAHTKPLSRTQNLTESRGRCTVTIPIFNNGAKQYWRNKHTNLVRYWMRDFAISEAEAQLSARRVFGEIRVLANSMVLYFIRFQACYVITSQRPLVDLQCQALLFALWACHLLRKNAKSIEMFLFGFGVGTVLIYFNWTDLKTNHSKRPWYPLPSTKTHKIKQEEVFSLHFKTFSALPNQNCRSENTTGVCSKLVNQLSKVSRW